MGRKVQIPKEQILDTAFVMLREKGAGAVNIKGVAEQVGCSTQPIAWHFGSMDGLRTELGKKAEGFLTREIVKTFEDHKGKGPTSCFVSMEAKRAAQALEEPDLVRFLLSMSLESQSSVTIRNLMEGSIYLQLRQGIMSEYKITEDDTYDLMLSTIGLSMGLRYLISSGAVELSREEVYEAIAQNVIRFLISLRSGKDKTRNRG